MALREELERSGNWLFRHRSYAPLLMFVPLAAAMQNFERVGQSHLAQEYWQLFCLTISLVGILVRVLTVGFVPSRTSGRNTHKQIAAELNTTGMYSIVRHPLYLGNFLIWLGLVMFCFVWWFLLIFVLAFWLYYERIVFAEEEFLRRQFGSAFDAWANRTPAIVPRPSQWQSPELGFSLRTVLRREYSAVLGVAATALLLDVAGHLAVDRKLVLEAFWIGVFSFGLVVWVVLRSLKRHTRLLHVPGR